MDFKGYFFDKLIFPKVVIIDKPGIIISKTIGRFSKREINTRAIYYPENIGIDLYINTKRKIGIEKTDELWYKIGKDTATRRLSFLGKSEIPNILIPSIVEHIFKIFYSIGMGFAKNIDYNHKKQSFVATGENCMICNETKSGHNMAGLVSGVLSFLLNKNIEAEVNCIDCPKNCKIIANPMIKEKYISNIEELRPLEDYYKINFPKDISELSNNFKSFSDFLKFKQIEINNKNKCFSIKGNTFVPSEMGLPGIMLNHYFKIGEEKMFKEIVVSSSEILMKNILKDESNLNNRINFFINIISSLGGGLTFHKKIGNKIILKFLYPPIDRKESCLFKALVINGYLNAVHNKKFKIISLTDNKIEFNKECPLKNI